MAKRFLSRHPVLTIFLVIVGAVLAYLILSVAATVSSFILMLAAALIFTGGDPNVFPAVIFTYLCIAAFANLFYLAPVIFVLLLLAISAYALGSAGLYLLTLLHRRSDDRLIKALKSGDPKLRRFAVVECGFRRLRRAEPDLYGVLYSDPDLDIRLCAYKTLGSMGQPAYDQILKTLGSTQDKGTKAGLIRLLGKIADPRQIGVLTDTYLADPNREIRAAALEALEEINSQDVVDPLLRMLGVTLEKEPKLQIFGILRRHKDALPVERLIGLLAIEADTDVRLQIYRIFRDINDVRSNALFYRALKDEDVRVRDFAAETLRFLGISLPPRETIREIVKVPCEYCGSLVEVTSRACASCGAPLNPCKI